MLELAELEERRNQLCRLDLVFALQEFEEAEESLQDRGLLTLTASPPPALATLLSGSVKRTSFGSNYARSDERPP